MLAEELVVDEELIEDEELVEDDDEADERVYRDKRLPAPQISEGSPEHDNEQSLGSAFTLPA